MKILILAHFYPPEVGGAAARLHGLSRWMATEHDVTVIAGFPNYPAGVIPDEYHWRFGADEELDNVHIKRCWVYATPKRGSIRRLANYFSFVASSLLRGLLLREKFDVVVASCPPLFIGITGWLLARAKRSKFVFDIRDIWPDVAVEAGEFKQDALITRLGTSLANFLYRRSDHITPVTENKRLRLIEKKVPGEKISVVCNGVDLDQVTSPDDTDAYREELGLSGKCLFLYAGLIGIAQRVEILAEAAAAISDDDEIHFLIVGDGVRRPQIEAIVDEHKLTNVTFLPRQPREAMSRILSMADVCTVPLATSDLQDAVPSKLLEAWAYSKPAILVAAGEAADLVSQSGGGKVVAPGDVESLVQAVREMKANPENRAAMGESGHRFVAEHLDRPILAKQMSAVFSSLVERDTDHKAVLS